MKPVPDYLVDQLYKNKGITGVVYIAEGHLSEGTGIPNILKIYSRTVVYNGWQWVWEPLDKDFEFIDIVDPIGVPLYMTNYVKDVIELRRLAPD